MKNKLNFLHIRVTEAAQKRIKQEADNRGMTITGMIRLAIRKLFKIEL